MMATVEISEALTAYSSPLEHVSDELKRLDLLIRSGLDARAKVRTPSALDPFVGLVVSEEEVSALLSSPSANGHRREHDDGSTNQIEEIDRRIESRLKASAERGL